MIIIYGPTASGKTDFSLALAAHIPCEIINMDIGSFYAPLTIGTAKPNWRQSTVVHHLFDILDRPVNYTVTQYRADVSLLIQQITSRGKVPMLVGGSGFYLKSLFFPPQANSVNTMAIDNNQSTQQLWDELNSVDPARAIQIHKNDRYRIERALLIWHETGTLPSTQAPVYQPLQDALVCHVTRDRTQLYERINMRVVSMIENGLIGEVQQLRGTEWETFLREKKLIGYDDVFVYLEGPRNQIAREQMITTIATKSRNYAKRQETFWRMLEKQLSAIEGPHAPKMETINLTLIDLELYIKQLLQRYKNLKIEN